MTFGPSDGGFPLRAIFISYRRNDAEGEAGRLFDDLVARFDDQSVFMDVHAIKPGHDFRKAIDESIDGCTVLLALIGPDWFTAKNAAGNASGNSDGNALAHNRLEDENDFVRLEVGSALRRRIPVIPVLVRATKMPQPEQLPPDLKDLAYRNAVELTHARWKSDVQVLAEALRPYLESPSDASTQHRERTAAFAPSAVTQQTQAVAKAPQFDPELLGRLGKELAAYIGPIAEIVVKRSAKRALSLHDLHEALAREIETGADRAKFQAFCNR